MAVADRVKQNLERMVRGVLPLIDYQALYRGRVVSQSSDKKRVDVKPDNPKIPGLTAELVLFGPKATVEVASGTNCLIGWDGADPSKPIALLFFSESGTRGLARFDDTSDCGTLVFVPGTGGASLSYFKPGVPPTGSPPGIALPLEGKIDSASDTIKID